MNDNDTVAVGTIEFSGPGISYSHPLPNLSDTGNMGSWQTLIDAAEVDSLSPIVLGTTGYIPNDSTVSSTTTGAPVSTVRYASPLAMQLDLESGKIDGCFSYNRYPTVKRGYDIVSSPAPYYCAIVPGVSEHAQRNSLLTTALYYRFNEDKYSVVFDGDGVTSLNRLCITSGDMPRHYDYDPGRGRTLGRELAHSTRTVSIAVSDHNLEKAALYFSDILSRDRIRTSLADENEKADCALVFVPIDLSDRGLSLRYLYDRLAADTTRGESVNQTIRIVGKYLELEQTTVDSVQTDRFLTLAEQSLAEDIGVFPLFRPGIYFIARKDLKGYSFDPSGRFDVSGLVKILLPSHPTGASQ